MTEFVPCGDLYHMLQVFKNDNFKKKRRREIIMITFLDFHDSFFFFSNEGRRSGF